MTKPNHVITCVSCGWRPDQSLVDLSDLGKHTHDEGKPPVSFSLLPYCPKDDRLLKVSRVVPAHDGRRRVHYDCTCHRSFRVVV